MVTLRDIADRAGVSIKTVSRIVNGEAAVNPDTRDHVLGILDALNYVPNSAARQMRLGTSTTFGLMTDAVATTPYSVDLVRGAQSVLGAEGQTLLIASNDGDLAKEEALWRTFRAQGVAGVIYAAMFHRAHEVGETAFRRPLVLANCFDPDRRIPSIVPDDEAGGYEQARHLLALGHRRIAAVTLSPLIEATRLRGEGIRRAFAEAGVAFDESLELRGMRGDIWREELVAFDVARALLERADRPTAVICGNDQVALQVYCAAFALGLSIPDDLSVVGFDDMRLIAEAVRPSLTTVALPYFEIGRQAAEMVRSGAVAPGGPARRVACPLVERGSTRALA